MAKQKETVWVAQLERFDYTLVAVGKTEKEAREAILKEYIKAFTDLNGEDPRETVAEEYGYDTTTFYDIAEEELFAEEVKFGEVKWY